MTARYVRIPQFADDTGHTVGAVETKTQQGVGPEGKHYRCALDGTIVMDMVMFKR